MRFIKYLLVFMVVMASGYVWSADKDANVYTQDKVTIMVAAHQPEFTIKLKSNPTTGYSWFLKEYPKKLIEPVKHVYEAPQNKKLMGAPGYEFWTFKMKSESFVVPHHVMIQFVYARPWEKHVSTKPLIFTIITK
ncbi:MAG: protease inhibitor I42 family protein [Gammaproteobacteria bacterium]|nr:protease inhibitor I42 family protein [Gammaproteobacteria bacterium]